MKIVLDENTKLVAYGVIIAICCNGVYDVLFDIFSGNDSYETIWLKSVAIVISMILALLLIIWVSTFKRIPRCPLHNTRLTDTFYCKDCDKKIIS